MAVKNQETLPLSFFNERNKKMKPVIQGHLKKIADLLKSGIKLEKEGEYYKIKDKHACELRFKINTRWWSPKNKVLVDLWYEFPSSRKNDYTNGVILLRDGVIDFNDRSTETKISVNEVASDVSLAEELILKLV